MALFTAEELEELRRADEELEAGFRQTQEEIVESRRRDRQAKLDRKDHRNKKIADQKRAYYEANREKIADQKRAYYEANREKIADQKRAYREANREKIADQQRAYLDKWLSKDIWMTEPPDAYKYKPRELDEDEMAAIRRMMEEDW